MKNFDSVTKPFTSSPYTPIPMTIKIGIVGLGRIGKIHFDNAHFKLRNAEVIAASDPFASAREYALARGVANVYESHEALLENDALDAVVICSPTTLHAQQVRAFTAAGKHIFCEKPLDLDLDVIRELDEGARAAGIQLMLGFNRRADGEYRALQAGIEAGKVGDLHILRITSRDPGPPPVSYIKTSGGLFLDMTIHDFDMARFLTGSEVEEVYARGAVRVDPAIGEAGDIDTATLILQCSNGAMVMIENSRKAVYGYDVRAEAFGSGGMLSIGNRLHNLALHYDESGGHVANPMDFFMDRFEDSYLTEMTDFVNALEQGQEVPVTAHDGLMASAIGLAGQLSLRENRPVRVSEILNRKM
jgi:myo-inositol 2-dehydrogenase/D-chiro-inositol 1-dehydrogenase